MVLKEAMLLATAATQRRWPRQAKGRCGFGPLRQSGSCVNTTEHGSVGKAETVGCRKIVRRGALPTERA